MTQSNENKWMFEAKRIDNGNLIEFSLGDCVSHSCVDWFVDRNEHPAIEIDPSTIKPLFTTEPKREEFLFENVDRKPLTSLNDDEASMVMMGWVQTGSGRFGTTQIFNGSGWVGLLHAEELRANYVCRVKAPGYSFDDALTGCRNATEEANGLGGS